MTPQLLHGPPGFGRGVLFCLLVGVALAEVSMPRCALLRCPPEDNVRAISSASSSVTGLTASPVSLFTRARQYKLRCANCSESSEALLVLGFSTLVASASRGAGGDSGPSRLDMLTSEVMLPAEQVRWRGKVFFKAQHARCACALFKSRTFTSTSNLGSAYESLSMQLCSFFKSRILVGSRGFRIPIPNRLNCPCCTHVLGSCSSALHKPVSALRLSTAHDCSRQAHLRTRSQSCLSGRCKTRYTTGRNCGRSCKQRSPEYMR